MGIGPNMVVTVRAGVNPAEHALLAKFPIEAPYVQARRRRQTCATGLRDAPGSLPNGIARKAVRAQVGSLAHVSALAT